MIAGNIIPAIATTTASVTGLVMMELYKVLQDKPVEDLRNINYDLGANTYMLFEADPPRKTATKTTKEFDDGSFQMELKAFGDAKDECESRAARYRTLITDLKDLVGEDANSAVAAAEKSLEDTLAYASTLEEPTMEEHTEEKTIVAYPDPFTKWDKIVIPETVTTGIPRRCAITLPSLIQFLVRFSSPTLTRMQPKWRLAWLCCVWLAG